MRPVIADAVARLAPQASDAGLTLTFAPGVEIELGADTDRLAQVVTNLVGNAIRATPSGGSVVVSVERTGATASISVTDTGEGLASEDLERVFERFYRRTLPGGDGSGIGLTIARRIMRAHGGVSHRPLGGPRTRLDLHRDAARALRACPRSCHPQHPPGTTPPLADPPLTRRPWVLNVPGFPAASSTRSP